MRRSADRSPAAATALVEPAPRPDDREARRSDQVPMPSFLQLEPVGICNLRCRMCLAGYRRDGARGSAAFLDPARFSSLLDDLDGIDSLHLQGLGEPFLHPHLLDMVREASARGITVTTNSNLLRFTKSLAHACVDSGLDTLHVSVDAAEPALYADIRGASLAAVVRNLRLLLAARRGARAEHPRVRLVGVLMRSTLDQVVGLVRLAIACGVDGLSVQGLAQDLSEDDLPAHLVGLRESLRAESLGPGERERARSAFAQAQALAADSGLDLRLPALRDEAADRAAANGAGCCTWPWSGMYVTCRGEAVPCCMIGLPERASVGNVFRDGARSVWQGDAMAAFRRRLRQGPPPSSCLGCSIYRGTF